MRALVAARADPNALDNDRYDIVTIAGPRCRCRRVWCLDARMQLAQDPGERPPEFGASGRRRPGACLLESLEEALHRGILA